MKKEKLVKAETTFPVVGVGASAGGLDAFRKFLHVIPEKSGIAFVLVQHLAPGHESLLPELLQKVTKIPVISLGENVKLAPDHIYVIPGDKILIANDGILQVSPRDITSKPARNLIIDIFFQSLAEVHQSNAIGVVLSGSASDGTEGLKAIKDNGGITFAQDEHSAAYDSMPNSAVQAGVVDFILPPEEIPLKILEITQNISRHDHEENEAIPTEDEIFKQIISLLRLRKGTDFTYYKQSTVRRRILRRMALNKNEDLSTYLKKLRENKTEQDILYHDLLIPVTSFFRDAKTFENLCDTVLPEIIKAKASNDGIRIWVAGCSTGEEAYSIAMCVKETLDDRPMKIQIFATDLSETAIAKAREGLYTKRETESLSPAHLKEYFTKSNGNYHVNKSIRDMCIFAVHNFLKDPPFGKIDLINCRNVLIYMGPYLQKRALNTFHYALNPLGYLLLGKSETISSVPDLFTTASKNEKLFIRKEGPGKFVHLASQRTEHQISIPVMKEPLRNDFQKTADDIILNRYSPSGVVVNDALDIVHFRGNTNPFLQQLPGKPSHNLLKMARNGLSFELRNLIHKVKKEKTTVIKENISFELDGNMRNIAIEAMLLPNTIEPFFLVLFHDKSVGIVYPPALENVSKLTEDEKDHRIQQLEQELSQTREDMRSITEDQETTNEELQSANEELLSSSEELQSLNEELETGKEELQSTNEELIIVNQEMINLLDQLKHERDYAESIVETVRDPLLVLDSNLRVKSANNSYYRTFRVNELETEGKLIYELNNEQWRIPELRTLLEKILPDKSKFSDFELKGTFPNIGERILLLNAREIRENGAEKLILLAMEDITDNKKKDDLEKAVVRRTNELKYANERLGEKNIELEKANKELASFAYVSSHDLQEPLRKIQTFVTRLLEKETQNLTENGIEYFKKMQDAARRMQTLIEDLLSFSRVNNAERKFEPVDINEIVEEVKYDLKEKIEEKHARITTKGLCTIQVIPFQFRQLMQNLISNSLKFAKKDKPLHITITSRVMKGDQLLKELLLPDKDYCHFVIEDNGIGFEPKFNELIFEVFQRLHGNDEYEGTGIGLAIVKKIIENHNGLVFAQGELNKGARFDFYVPTA